MSWCLLAAALCAGCAASTRAARPAPVEFEKHAWTYDGRDGHRLLTRHYEIYTTIRDEKLVENLPGIIEAAYDEYRKLAPPAREPAERMPVYLFATRAEWAAFTREFTGWRAPVFLRVRNGGYSERGVSVIEYVAHQTTFPLMAHEGFHQYLHHCVNPNVPAWLNEGLAVAFEGQHWKSAGYFTFDYWHNPARFNQLADALIRKKLIPLRTLLATNAGRVVNEPPRTVSTYYAQVWTLVLFLREGENGKYAPAFSRLLAQLGAADLEQQVHSAAVWSDGAQDSSGEALFRAFISDDLDAVEQELHAFLRQRILNEKPPPADGRADKS